MSIGEDAASIASDEYKQLEDSEITVYMTSIVSQHAIFKKQQEVLDFLEARKIPYKAVDMCANLKARPEMIGKLPDDVIEKTPRPLPPQVFNGDGYCGDYDMFFDAKECDLAYSFFRIMPPEGSKVSFCFRVSQYYLE